MKKVAVIGGRAAGMMAAWACAQAGCQTDLYEKNEKLGKKLYITGKGRCNLTNGCAIEDFFDEVCTNARFLYSSVYGFTNRDVMQFFESMGTPLKEERGKRIFPVSDHASDVTKALEKAMRLAGVRIHLQTEVLEIKIKGSLTEKTQDQAPGQVIGIRTKNDSLIPYDAVIVATGGLSYPSTGSTGDGLRFAKAAGLKVITPSPSLVPLEVAEGDAAAMQGLSLKNVRLTLKSGKKIYYQDQGEMLFTHFGISGPLVLTASSHLKILPPGSHFKQDAKAPDGTSSDDLRVYIDLKPALSEETLDRRFIREFEASPNKQLSNILPALYPAKLIPVILQRAGINPEKKARDITKKERADLVAVTKKLVFHVTGTRGFREAIITRGGVDVKAIEPATMEAKTVKGLFFAGEVLDVDAHTGGFNLQIAWSTGYAAGMGAASRDVTGE